MSLRAAIGDGPALRKTPVVDRRVRRPRPHLLRADLLALRRPALIERYVVGYGRIDLHTSIIAEVGWVLVGLQNTSLPFAATVTESMTGLPYFS